MVDTLVTKERLALIAELATKCTIPSAILNQQPPTLYEQLLKIETDKLLKLIQLLDTGGKIPVWNLHILNCSSICIPVTDCQNRLFISSDINSVPSFLPIITMLHELTGISPVKSEMGLIEGIQSENKLRSPFFDFLETELVGTRDDSIFRDRVFSYERLFV